MFRRWKAKRRGIPFEDRKFWPPYYINRWGTIPGQKIMQKIYDAKPGDIVPVMHSDAEVHFYRVVSEGGAWGDDHIVSPRQWHITYHHSEGREPKIKGITVFVQRPGLYVAFHWWVYVTSFQRKKEHQPRSVALAGWPLGTLEISFI